jgi:hypothetical protein
LFDPAAFYIDIIQLIFRFIHAINKLTLQLLNESMAAENGLPEKKDLAGNGANVRLSS